MSVKLRQELERKIITQVITDLLAANFLITVNDGEDDVLTHSNDQEGILGAMFSTDEDILFISTITARHSGWVKFIYGNDGYDVIHDYTTNLEPHMRNANKLADSYCS